jgi:hypothetical protein
MQANSAERRSLASHWRAGGWFGSQLGGTAWLFISALVLGSASTESAAVLIGCGLASNLVGCVLWSQRARLDPYRALQALVVVIVLSGVAATRWLEVRGEFHLLDPRVSPHTMYLLLSVLLLGLLAVFESKRQAAKRAAA